MAVKVEKEAPVKPIHIAETLPAKAKAETASDLEQMKLKERIQAYKQDLMDKNPKGCRPHEKDAAYEEEMKKHIADIGEKAFIKEVNERYPEIIKERFSADWAWPFRQTGEYFAAVPKSKPPKQVFDQLISLVKEEYQKTTAIDPESDGGKVGRRLINALTTTVNDFPECLLDKELVGKLSGFACSLLEDKRTWWVWKGNELVVGLLNRTDLSPSEINVISDALSKLVWKGESAALQSDNPTTFGFQRDSWAFDSLFTKDSVPKERKQQEAQRAIDSLYSDNPEEKDRAHFLFHKFDNMPNLSYVRCSPMSDDQYLLGVDRIAQNPFSSRSSAAYVARVLETAIKSEIIVGDQVKELKERAREEANKPGGCSASACRILLAEPRETESSDAGKRLELIIESMAAPDATERQLAWEMLHSIDGWKNVINQKQFTKLLVRITDDLAFPYKPGTNEDDDSTESAIRSSAYSALKEITQTPGWNEFTSQLQFDPEKEQLVKRLVQNLRNNFYAPIGPWGDTCRFYPRFYNQIPDYEGKDERLGFSDFPDFLLEKMRDPDQRARLFTVGAISQYLDSNHHPPLLQGREREIVDAVIELMVDEKPDVRARAAHFIERQIESGVLQPTRSNFEAQSARFQRILDNAVQSLRMPPGGKSISYEWADKEHQSCAFNLINSLAFGQYFDQYQSLPTAFQNRVDLSHYQSMPTGFQSREELASFILDAALQPNRAGGLTKPQRPLFDGEGIVASILPSGHTNMVSKETLTRFIDKTIDAVSTFGKEPNASAFDILYYLLQNKRHNFSESQYQRALDAFAEALARPDLIHKRNAIANSVTLVLLTRAFSAEQLHVIISNTLESLEAGNGDSYKLFLTLVQEYSSDFTIRDKARSAVLAFNISGNFNNSDSEEIFNLLTEGYQYKKSVLEDIKALTTIYYNTGQLADRIKSEGNQEEREQGEKLLAQLQSVIDGKIESLLTAAVSGEAPGKYLKLEDDRAWCSKLSTPWIKLNALLAWLGEEKPKEGALTKPMMELIQRSLQKNDLAELVRLVKEGIVEEEGAARANGNKLISKTVHESVFYQLAGKHRFRPKIELVSNSIDAKPKGHKGDYQVDVTVDDKARSVKVVDHGMGMGLVDFVNLLVPFKSTKDELEHIGRFGRGFLSNLIYCVENPGLAKVVVESFNGEEAFKITFMAHANPLRETTVDDLYCVIEKSSKKTMGTEVTIKNIAELRYGEDQWDSMGEMFKEHLNFFDPARATIRVNGDVVNPGLKDDQHTATYSIPAVFDVDGKSVRQDVRVRISCPPEKLNDFTSGARKPRLEMYSQGIFIKSESERESIGTMKVDFPSGVGVLMGRTDFRKGEAGKLNPNYESACAAVYESIMEYAKSHSEDKEKRTKLRALLPFFRYQSEVPGGRRYFDKMLGILFPEPTLFADDTLRSQTNSQRFMDFFGVSVDVYPAKTDYELKYWEDFIPPLGEVVDKTLVTIAKDTGDIEQAMEKQASKAKKPATREKPAKADEPVSVEAQETPGRVRRFLSLLRKEKTGETVPVVTTMDDLQEGVGETATARAEPQLAPEASTTLHHLDLFEDREFRREDYRFVLIRGGEEGGISPFLFVRHRDKMCVNIGHKLFKDPSLNARYMLTTFLMEAKQKDEHSIEQELMGRMTDEYG